MEKTNLELERIKNGNNININKQQELLDQLEKEKRKREETQSKLFELVYKNKETENLLHFRIKEEKKRLSIAEGNLSFPFHIILLGSSGAGKSTLLKRYITGTYVDGGISTIVGAMSQNQNG